MIDFTRYTHDKDTGAVSILARRPGNQRWKTTLADSGAVFFHAIHKGVLYSEWVGVKFYVVNSGESVTLQTYHLGYIGI